MIGEHDVKFPNNQYKYYYRKHWNHFIFVFMIIFNIFRYRWILLIMLNRVNKIVLVFMVVEKTHLNKEKNLIIQENSMTTCFFWNTTISFWCMCFKPNTYIVKIKKSILSHLILIHAILEVFLLSHCWIWNVLLLFYFLLCFSNMTVYYNWLLSPAGTYWHSSFLVEKVFKTFFSLTRNTFCRCFITLGPCPVFFVEVTLTCLWCVANFLSIFLPPLLRYF